MAPRDAAWYEALLGASPGVVLVVDDDRTVAYADPSAEDELGHVSSALAGEPVDALVHSEDEPALRRRLDGAPEDGDGPGDPVRVRDADGRWHAATLTVADRRGADSLDGYVVTLGELAACEGAAAAPAKYRTLVEAAADPMFWLAPDGTVEMVNDALTVFMAADREELVGRRVDELFDEAVTDPVEAKIREALSGDVAADDPIRHEFATDGPDGTERWIETNLSTVVEAGEFRGTVGVLRDVTERKEREQELAAFETIVATAPVGLFTLDEDAVLTWANEFYADTLDLPRGELVGTPFTDLIEAGYYDEAVVEPYLDTVRDLLSSDEDVSEGDYLVETHLPGGTKLHEVHTALLPTDDGEFRGTVSAFRDVTTQKEYERQLERQNERLDAFTSVVSHDLRNPLAIAQGKTEIAIETGDLDHLADARDAHERMDALIGDLLALAREGRTVEDVSPVDLLTLAGDAWETADTGAATLRVDGPGRVLADADRLRQLLENLFRNAVEHGSASPRSSSTREDAVEHGTGGDPDRPLTVTVGALPDGDGFYVADDGVGVPPADRERVFDRGFTTIDGGTGFGLAIVETIADAHGWSVAVAESEAGGARFEIRGVGRPT